MADQLHISPDLALVTVATTAAIYLAFVVLVRMLGPRTLTGLASFDLACVVAFGAVIGRTAVLTEPTLMTGLIALLTLFVMQGLLGIVRQVPAFTRWVSPRPVVLVRDGVLLRDNMRRVHVVEDEIRQAVRRAGLPGLSRVGLITMERNGVLSVIPAGEVEQWLTADLQPAQPG